MEGPLEVGRGDAWRLLEVGRGDAWRLLEVGRGDVWRPLEVGRGDVWSQRVLPDSVSVLGLPLSGLKPFT